MGVTFALLLADLFLRVYKADIHSMASQE